MKRKSRAKLLPVNNEMILEESFKFLSSLEIRTLIKSVCHQWGKMSSSPNIWKAISKVKWSRWRSSQFGKFHFLFEKGATESEILNKEAELGFSLRQDIRELLKECSCFDLPSLIFQTGIEREMPLMPTHLFRITEWDSFDDACKGLLWNTIGLKSEELLDRMYGPKNIRHSHKHIFIGYDCFFMALLNVVTLEVIAVHMYDAETMIELGPFDEWFDKGINKMNVTGLKLQDFQRVSMRDRAAVICNLTRTFTQDFKFEFVETEKEERKRRMGLLKRLLDTIFSDSSLLCYFYTSSMTLYQDNPNMGNFEENLVFGPVVGHHVSPAEELMKSLVEYYDEKGDFGKHRILSKNVTFQDWERINFEMEPSFIISADGVQIWPS